MAFPLTNAHFAEKNLKYDKKRGSFEAITKHFYSSIKLYQDKINQYPRQASHAHGQYTRLHQFRRTFTAVNPIIIAIFSILKASYHPNQLIHIKEIFRAIFFSFVESSFSSRLSLSDSYHRWVLTTHIAHSAKVFCFVRKQQVIQCQIYVEFLLRHPYDHPLSAFSKYAKTQNILQFIMRVKWIQISLSKLYAKIVSSSKVNLTKKK